MSTVLLDADNLIKRCIMASATDDLQANGTWTGGVYGTLLVLTAFLSRSDVQADRIVAFFDCGVPLKRRTLLPDYKKDRKEKKNLLSDEDHAKAMGQMHLAREMLELLGVRCLAYKDREADDCVAAAVRCRGYNARPVVVSSDKDLLQTVPWGARVWSLSSARWLTEENFQEVFGVPPECWLLYRVLTGDPSDSVQGAKGVGETRARKLICDAIEHGLVTDADPYGQLLDLTSFIQATTHDPAGESKLGSTGEGATKRPAWMQGILDDLDRLMTTMRAVDLNGSFGPTPKLRDRLAEPTTLDGMSFLKFCKRLNFQSVLGDPDRFLKPFSTPTAVKSWGAASH